MTYPSPAAPPTVVREALLVAKHELEGWEKCDGIEAALAKIDAGLEALDRLSAPPPPPVEGPGLRDLLRRLADLPVQPTPGCTYVISPTDRAEIRRALAAEEAREKLRLEAADATRALLVRCAHAFAREAPAAFAHMTQLQADLRAFGIEPTP